MAIDPLLLVRDPPVARPKGRPRGALKLVEGSTGDPSPRATPSDWEASF